MKLSDLPDDIKAAAQEASTVAPYERSKESLQREWADNYYAAQNASADDKAGFEENMKVLAEAISSARTDAEISGLTS